MCGNVYGRSRWGLHVGGCGVTDGLEVVEGETVLLKEGAREEDEEGSKEGADDIRVRVLDGLELFTFS